MGLEYFSGSQFNKARCLIKYFLHYVMNNREPMGVNVVPGIVFHNMAKYFFRTMIETGEVLRVVELKMWIIDDFFTTWNSMIDRLRLTDREYEFGEDKLKSRMVECLIALIPLLHKESQKIIPIAAEKRIKVSIPGIDKELLGILDLLHKLIGFDGKFVTDFKTSVKPVNWKNKNGSCVSPKGKTPKQAWDDFGLTIYWILTYIQYGFYPDMMFFDNYMAWINEDETEVKTAFKRIPTYRTMDHIKALIDIANRLNECIEKNAFYPCPPDDNLCSPDWCGYFPCEFRYPALEGDFHDCNKCRNYTSGHKSFCSAQDNFLYSTINNCNFFKKKPTKKEIADAKKKIETEQNAVLAQLELQIFSDLDLVWYLFMKKRKVTND
jgi:hypothetical protein